VTRVFSAPLKYNFSRVKDAVLHCHIQTGSRTYPVGKGDLVRQSDTAQTLTTHIHLVLMLILSLPHSLNSTFLMYWIYLLPSTQQTVCYNGFTMTCFDSHESSSGYVQNLLVLAVLLLKVSCSRGWWSV
jgi:hypothetical protein